MAFVRPPHIYRTARERIAYRRAANARAARTRQRRRGGGCGSIVIGLIAVLLLVVVIIVSFTGMARQTLGDIEQERLQPIVVDPQATTAPVDAAAAAAAAEEQADVPRTTLEPFNILLLGVETVDDPYSAPRSDTLILVHVDPQEKWASMLSIPRDSVVQIPYLGQQKINVAYPYGYLNAEEIYGAGADRAAAGGTLAAETVENFLGVQVDHIAQVDFRGFERTIDIMGGLQIDIPKPVIDPEYPTENFGFERIYIPAGLQVLDGAMTLRYARSRHSSSDFDRSCRQQRVLRAMLRQAREQNLLDQVSKLPELVENLERSVSTTLPVSDLGVLYGLAELGQSLSSDRIIQMSIHPSNVRVISEQGSDIYWNPNDIRNLVARMMAGPQSTIDEETVYIQVLNGAGERGLASQVTQHLGSQDFAMVEPGDAPRPYEFSTIIDYTGNPEERQRLADALGIDQAHVLSSPEANSPPAPYNTGLVLVLGNDYNEAWTVLSDDAPPPPAPAPATAGPVEEVPNLPPSCSPDF
ncbi:MAG: LCP family protein [Chloroflexaceae bacterium]|nr:LCP family protein [Chloroflexaceae bacterium]